MRVTQENNDDRTIYCGNLSDEVTDEILYELFNQAGPVESVRRPKDHSGKPKSFAFIVYKHECSVPYALELLKWDKLFNRNLNLNSHSRLFHIPVLDTHLSEFIGPTSYQNQDYGLRNYQEQDNRNNWNRERGHCSEGTRRSEGNHRSERNHINESLNKHHKHSSRGRDRNEPASWAELNALKGKGSHTNGHHRNDLQSPHKRESSSKIELSAMPDYNTLIQMGQQMMLPGVMGLSGMFSPQMGFGPGLGCNNLFPSMQGKMNGGEKNYTDRSRGHRDREGRGSARDHPYSDYRDDHRRHDRGYSSSRSSHDRERRDRRSR